jgi:hypothetical protein
MSDVIPATFGDYRVEGLLGQGRVGPCFRGSHMVLGMPVALRVIDAKYTGAPGFKTRLVQYAHSLTPLVHPNVVRVYHVGEQEGLEYIVNELVPGGTLEPPQADAPWSPSTWSNVGLVRQVAEGLAAVHWKGLVHGDVRRSNLLLGHSDSGQVQAKLADVGLFTLVEEQSAAKSTSDGVARDIAQLGAVLYELTTGRSTAEGPALEFPAGFPDDLRTTIVRCLGLDPAKRFSNCAEVTEALGVVLTRERSASAERGRAAGVEQDADRGAVPSSVVAPTVRRNVNPPRPPAPLAPGGPKVPCIHAFDDAGTPIDTQFVRASGLTIGRGPANVIVLASAAVAMTHVRIDWDVHRVTVTDLGSDIGTLLQGQRLLPQVAQEWGPEQWVQVGPYWLWLQRPSADPTAINTTEVMLDHDSKSLVITPGKGAVCRLTMVNQRAEVDHLKISVEGIPSDWVELPTAPPRLNAFQKQDIAIPINVPKSPTAKAGDYRVTFHAQSIANPEAQPGSADAHWTVLRYDAASASITPSRAGGVREAHYTMVLENDGNSDQIYLLTGADEERQLRCEFSTDGSVERNKIQVDVPRGEKVDVKVKVSCERRWFGTAQAYPFVIDAAPLDGKEPLTTEGQFSQRPMFPVWAIAVVPILLLALLLVMPPYLKPDPPSLTISPQNPLPGGRLTLTWKSPDASRVQILVNELPISTGPSSPSGTYEFPQGFDKDTRIRVMSHNLFGNATSEIPVILKPPPPAAMAVIEQFQVTPQSVQPDQQVTITWRTRDAMRVELQPIGSVPLSGTQSHSPTADTVYTLNAFNKDNVPMTQTVAVRVRQPTINSPLGLELTASSTGMQQDKQGKLVGVGQSVVFAWRATNAARVRIDAVTPTSLEGQGGNKMAELRGEGTYTFTLVATNDKGVEFRSTPVVIRATCDNVVARAFTFRFGCNKNLELRWK